MSNYLLSNLNANKEKLEKLKKDNEGLNLNIQEIIKDLNQVMKTCSEYFSNIDEQTGWFSNRAEKVKEHFEVINLLFEEQVEQITLLQNNLTGLSLKYGAPKEVILENLNSLKELHKLRLEKKKLEDSNNNNNTDYYLDLIESEQKIINEIKQQSHLSEKMLDDYENGNDEIENYLQIEDERLKNIEERKREEDKISKETPVLKNKPSNNIFSAIFGGISSILNKGYDKMLEINQAGINFGRVLGLNTQQLTKHWKSLAGNYKNIARDLGMEFKDIYKFQTNYSEVTEKGTMLTTEQIGAVAAMSRSTGEQAINIASKNLDIFTSSFDTVFEYVGKGMHRAALEGLNVKAYSETFANNIKMASQYTFKNGINGIQNLTLMAQRLKFKLESIGAALDNFSNLESAIETSAKIQVLGGSFANNFSNPLIAMSEALTDGEAFTKRIVNTIGENATFNQETGEINLSPYDKQRLKAFSDALNISFDELFNISTQIRKSKEIERVMGNTSLSKEEIAYLSNKSQYNADNKKWEIVGADSKTKIDITKLNKEELNKIRDVDTHEKALLANISQLKDIIYQTASKQISQHERYIGVQEFFALSAAQKLQNLPDSLLKIVELFKVLGILGFTSAIQDVGSLFKKQLNKFGKYISRFVSSMAKYIRNTRIVRSVTQSLSNTRFFKTLTTAAQQVNRTFHRIRVISRWTRMATTRAVRNAGSAVGSALTKVASGTKIGKSVVSAAKSVSKYAKLIKGAKFLSKIGKFTKGVPLLSTVLAGVEGGLTHLSYEEERDYILSRYDLKLDEKIKSLTEAKKTRNQGYGSATGGLIGSIAGGAAGGAIAGSSAPIIGTVIGAVVGAIVGTVVGIKTGESIDIDEKDVKEEILKYYKENGIEIDEDGNMKVSPVFDLDYLLKNIQNIEGTTKLIRDELSYLKPSKRSEPGVKERKMESTIVKYSNFSIKVNGNIQLKNKDKIFVNNLIRNTKFKKEFENIIKQKIISKGNKKVYI